MNQFVNQLMLGQPLYGSTGPPDFDPLWMPVTTWIFAAQYLWVARARAPALELERVRSARAVHLPAPPADACLCPPPPRAAWRSTTTTPPRRRPGLGTTAPRGRCSGPSTLLTITGPGRSRWASSATRRARAALSPTSPSWGCSRAMARARGPSPRTSTRSTMDAVRRDSMRSCPRARRRAPAARRCRQLPCELACRQPLTQPDCHLRDCATSLAQSPRAPPPLRGALRDCAVRQYALPEQQLRLRYAHCGRARAGAHRLAAVLERHGVGHVPRPPEWHLHGDSQRDAAGRRLVSARAKRVDCPHARRASAQACAHECCCARYLTHAAAAEAHEEARVAARRFHLLTA